jgi:ribosomal protein S18 acetylase RimI-like enzyme
MFNINETYMTCSDTSKDNSESHNNICRHFWVAVDDKDTVLGCVGIIESTYDVSEKVIYESASEGDVHPQHVGEIVRMSVAESARGKGVATMLYNVLERFARQCGMKRIVLSTLEEMLLAVGLYKKLGYQLLLKTNVDVNFYKHIAEEEGFEAEAVVIVHYGKDLL